MQGRLHVRIIDGRIQEILRVCRRSVVLERTVDRLESLAQSEERVFHPFEERRGVSDRLALKDCVLKIGDICACTDVTNRF